MSESATRGELRTAAVAGWLSATVILVNAADHAGLLPTTALTQLVAPLAQIFAIGLVLGLYAAARRDAGPLLLAGLIANLAALAALSGVEIVTNLVFAYLDSAQIDELLAGPLNIALVSISMLFIVATLVFAAALWRNGEPAGAARALFGRGPAHRPAALRPRTGAAALAGPARGRGGLARGRTLEACGRSRLRNREQKAVRTRAGSGPLLMSCWSRRQDSNPQPTVYKTVALPVKATPACRAAVTARRHDCTGPAKWALSPPGRAGQSSRKR
ncbi:hypothetical protein GCM10029992_20270 [Glycomyces albus]